MLTCPTRTTDLPTLPGFACTPTKEVATLRPPPASLVAKELVLDAAARVLSAGLAVIARNKGGMYFAVLNVIEPFGIVVLHGLIFRFSLLLFNWFYGTDVFGRL